MKKDIIILGSTGSIGSSTIASISKSNKFKIKLLTTNKNAKKILKQAILFKVKNIIIEDKEIFRKYYHIFKKNKINAHLGIKNIDKIINKKVSYCVNSISGIEGLGPTLKTIPITKNILIANKESIICAWDLIKKKLDKYKTQFIPIDSEHFSIWKLIRNEQKKNISKIILTASGGPFLNKSLINLSNIKPKFALKHPNWKMGKKISIDSSTMMNKIFELIEAKKIFNLTNEQVSILIHPSSYIHAIVFFKGGLIKFLAHDTNMSIPISNALGITNLSKSGLIRKNIKKLNSISFMLPNKKKFPMLSIINLIPNNTSYFETILIALNDSLVGKYLNSEINYASIYRNLLRLIKSSFFKKYYKLKPKNIYDIKNMINVTNKYLNKHIRFYDK